MSEPVKTTEDLIREDPHSDKGHPVQWSTAELGEIEPYEHATPVEHYWSDVE